MPCFFKIKRLYLPLLNFNPFLMKKLLFLTAALTAALWANATTDNEHICVSSGGLITNDLCLPMDGSVSVTFGSIPDLTYFRWIPLGDLEFADGSSARDTTVTIVSNGYGKGTIRLQYRNGGCTSASTVDVFKSFTLPDTFAIAGPTCIASNIPDTVTFSLSGTISNQTYDWVLPTGWELLSTNAAKTQMLVRTNGVAGTHTVSAFAIGTSTCGNSDTISYSTDIPTYATSIGYSLMFTMNVYGINNTSGKTISTVNWTFLQNNEIVVDALSSTTGNMVYLTDNYASIGDIQNSSIYTIVAMITFTDGCRVRLTYGAETEFANFQEAAMAPLSIKRVTNRSDELQISPNPSSSEITIEIGSQTNKIATIAIANMSGRIVKQHENFCIGQKLNIAELPDGQYVLCVQIDGKKSIEKFIKK